MGIVKINHTRWVRVEDVAAIESETTIGGESGNKHQQRTTTFRSASGAALVTLDGKQGWSQDRGDSNIELKIMHAMHDEAIRAVVEGVDARDPTEIANAVHELLRRANR